VGPAVDRDRSGDIAGVSGGITNPKHRIGTATDNPVCVGRGGTGGKQQNGSDHELARTGFELIEKRHSKVSGVRKGGPNDKFKSVIRK
jgi:hypothetical protein